MNPCAPAKDLSHRCPVAAQGVDQKHQVRERHIDHPQASPRGNVGAWIETVSTYAQPAVASPASLPWQLRAWIEQTAITGTRGEVPRRIAPWQRLGRM